MDREKGQAGLGFLPTLPSHCRGNASVCATEDVRREVMVLFLSPFALVKTVFGGQALQTGCISTSPQVLMVYNKAIDKNSKIS